MGDAPLILRRDPEHTHPFLDRVGSKCLWGLGISKATWAWLKQSLGQPCFRV